MELRECPDAVHLHVTGPVRLGETATLQELCINALERGQDVVVDLSTAEHLHAAALQILRALEIRLTAVGRSFAVAAPSSKAATAIDLGGLGRWLSQVKEQQ